MLVSLWSRAVAEDAIRALENPGALTAPPHQSRSAVLVGELHDRLHGRVDPVKVDNLKDI